MRIQPLRSGKPVSGFGRSTERGGGGVLHMHRRLEQLNEPKVGSSRSSPRSTSESGKRRGGVYSVPRSLGGGPCPSFVAVLEDLGDLTAVIPRAINFYCSDSRVFRCKGTVLLLFQLSKTVRPTCNQLRTRGSSQVQYCKKVLYKNQATHLSWSKTQCQKLSQLWHEVSSRTVARSCVDLCVAGFPWRRPTMRRPPVYYIQATKTA